jgi:hypothetical protein
LNGVNNFNYNGDSGMEAGLIINADGAIKVSRITANYNSGGGAWLDNDNSLTTQANVVISGYGVFEGNGWAAAPTLDGLIVKSHGAISLTNITANFNFGNGADLNSVGLTSTHAVTLNGVNNFNYNGTSGTESGLIIHADGNITAYNLTASFNYYAGAVLDNYTNWDVNDFSGFGSVKVYGYGTFVSNYHDDGLYVYTLGSITLNRVVADYNGDSFGDDGIQLIGAGSGSITLVCSSAWGNYSYGLEATTTGLLTLKGFIAYANGAAPELLSYGSIFRTTCP